MIKRFTPLLLLPLLLLSACTPQKANSEPKQETLSLVATTYPIYLFLSEVTRGADGVSVTPLINQSISCLHNYTLSVNEMKVMEGADVLFMNGAGLDDFVLDSSHSNASLTLVDCSSGMNLLPAHEDTEEPVHEEVQESNPAHDHDGDWDPHYWLDPVRASSMLTSMAQQLSKLDPDNADLYQKNAATATETITTEYARLQQELAPLTCRKLITFHDGFAYFADAFDLKILMSIEEEEGQEASAKVISQAIASIKNDGLPAIFTEEFSSDATAKAIARENPFPIKICPLTLIMSGSTENPGISVYLAAMEQNVTTVLEALS